MDTRGKIVYSILIQHRTRKNEAVFRREIILQLLRWPQNVLVHIIQQIIWLFMIILGLLIQFYNLKHM